MAINWEIVGVISEAVGAIAVVITLVYLAVQIRQSTRMMRSTAKHSLTEATQNLIFKFADHPDAWVKLVSGAEPATPEEDARMSLLTRAMLRGFESQCYQHQVGLLEEDEWSALRKAIRDICALPGVSRYWAQVRPHMSERLQQVVDENPEDDT